MRESAKTKRPTIIDDVLALKAVDHLEFWVGNAKQAAYYYRNVFGFNQVAYAGPETGVRDRASYVLEQGKIRFVFSSALSPQHPIGQHVEFHGDGVKSIALEVDNVERIYDEVLKRGAKGVAPPKTERDTSGTVKTATVATYGDTVHTFVARAIITAHFFPASFLTNVLEFQLDLKRSITL